MAKHGSRRTRDHLGSLVSPSLRSPPISIGSIRDRALRQVEDRRLTDPLFHEEAKSYLREARRLSVAERVDPKREYARQELIKSLAQKRLNQKYTKTIGPFHFKLFDNAPAVPAGVKFKLPKMVAICVRRRIRREVMHALHPHFIKHRGRGGSKNKKYRKAKWNEFSLIRC